MTANNQRRSVNSQPGAPALVEFKNFKFLIVNKPNQASLPAFVKELKKHNAKVVVRCCDPSYSTESLTEEGIRVVDCFFEDGAAPPVDIIRKWLDVVDATFRDHPDGCVAVHCVAGLGRAPVLVAVALMEQGMKYTAAVELIRTKRRGAINQKQLEFLEFYKPTNKPCCIM